MWQGNIYLFNKHSAKGPGCMCQRDVGGDTKNSKIKKDPLKAIKPIFES